MEFDPFQRLQVLFLISENLLRINLNLIIFYSYYMLSKMLQTTVLVVLFLKYMEFRLLLETYL